MKEMFGCLLALLAIFCFSIFASPFLTFLLEGEPLMAQYSGCAESLNVPEWAVIVTHLGAGVAMATILDSMMEDK